MSRRYWITIAAIGLALCLSSLGETQNEDRAPDHPSQDTGDGEASFSIPVRIIESEADQQARADVEEQSRQREIEGVGAQKGMNDASQRMAFDSRIQTWLIFFGTVFVGFTLILMIQANRATQRMASDTRTIGQAQVRAYVGFETAQFGTMGPNPQKDFMQVLLVLRNAGQSPAIKATIEASAMVLPFPINDLSQVKREVEVREVGNISPNGHGSALTLFRFDHGAIEAAKKGDSFFILYAKIRYFDVFGRGDEIDAWFHASENLMERGKTIIPFDHNVPPEYFVHRVDGRAG